MSTTSAFFHKPCINVLASNIWKQNCILYLFRVLVCFVPYCLKYDPRQELNLPDPRALDWIFRTRPTARQLVTRSEGKVGWIWRRRNEEREWISKGIMNKLFLDPLLVETWYCLALLQKDLFKIYAVNVIQSESNIDVKIMAQKKKKDGRPIFPIQNIIMCNYRK